MCLQLTLGKLLNFTNVIVDAAKFRGAMFSNEVPEISYDQVLSSRQVDHFILRNSYWRKSVFTYTMKIIPTTVTAISFKSSSLIDSLETFLLPFDTLTWIGLLLSLFTISVVIASRKLQESLTSGANSFAKALFWTYACLSGQ